MVTWRAHSPRHLKSRFRPTRYGIGLFMLFPILLAYTHPADAQQQPATDINHLSHTHHYTPLHIQTVTSPTKEDVQNTVFYDDDETKIALFHYRPQISFKATDLTLAVGMYLDYDFIGNLHTSAPQGQNRGIFPDFANHLRYLRFPIVLSWQKDYYGVFTPDFSPYAANLNHIYEANFNYTGFKNTHLVIGIYKPVFTLEDSNSYTVFDAIERPAIVDAFRSIAAANGRLAVGGENWHDLWSLSAYLSGPTTGRHTSDFTRSQFGGAARFTLHPVSTKTLDLHLGMDATFALHGEGENYALSSIPELTINSTRLVGTGRLNNATNIWGINPELGFRYDNLLLKSEYSVITINREPNGTASTAPLHVQGWYIVGSYTLLGNPRYYNNRLGNFSPPKASFHPESYNWGALEWVGRWSVIDYNTGGIQGGRQTAWVTGLNWYPTPFTRVSLQYNHILSASSLTQTASRYGRHADFIAARLQMNF
ncbi:OprO/OprP family phosphate-selective porin [Entomobacter blattae]|uniref:Phosphate-selective porin O and P n=1 Tax=Entomobacter blattae TaxID=2762277 RepID=A0A7H1NR33_9PROT|nr:porin [Entomobacter blattae]QNT78243.1 Phosphate-selective porin O and P [Entomobacter blattae]